MIDKQQLQAMGEHQAEQHMCMAKQIEDLQARLQECAKGAAKMQEQRDAAYVMAGKSGLERYKFAQQLKAANRKIAVMAELLREVRQYPASDNNWGRGFGFLERIDAALAGELLDNVAGVGNMVPVGVGVVDASEVLSLCDSIIHGGAAHQWAIYAKASDLRLTAEAAMLAAAPKPEQPDTAWTDAPAPEPTPQDYRELQERHDRLLSEHKAAVDVLRDVQRVVIWRDLNNRIAMLLAGHVPSAPSVPKGWQIVPVEPNIQMLAAFVEAGGKAISGYKAMLAAAPKPEPTK